MRAAVLLLCLVTCTQKSSQATCVFIDTSGTYVDQIPEILQQVRLVVLPPMSSGDRLILMKIDSHSYGWDNVIASIDVPSSRGEAATAKRIFSAELDKAEFKSSKHTDISGALLYCNEYMNSVIDCPTRKMLIFSDMKEELPIGVNRTYLDNEFVGVMIAVVNTKRLAGDQKDPESYRKRMNDWQTRLKEHGAISFQVFMGPDKIQKFMEKSDGT